MSLPQWEDVRVWAYLAQDGQIIYQCSCGYFRECGIWCGPGHLNGRCPPKPAIRLDATAGRAIREPEA